MENIGIELLLMDVNWVAVVVATLIAFASGWLWYSDFMFGKKWQKAVGISPEDNAPMGHAMGAQLVGTFFMSWVIGIAIVLNSLQLAILVGAVLISFIKANGFYSKKKSYAIKVESGYLAVMTVVMIIVHALF